MADALNYGWLGMAEDINNYLSAIEADKDSNDRFKIYALEDQAPVSFLGMGEEIVLHGTEEYSIDGQRYNLAEALRTTDCGVGIRVLC